MLGVHGVLEFHEVTLLSLVLESVGAQDSEHDGLEFLQLDEVTVVHSVLHIVLEVKRVEDCALHFFVHVVLRSGVLVVLQTHVGQVADILLFGVFEFDGDLAILKPDGLNLEESRVEYVFGG